MPSSYEFKKKKKKEREREKNSNEELAHTMPKKSFGVKEDLTSPKTS